MNDVELTAAIGYASRRLERVAYTKIKEFKESGFLSTGEGVQEIREEALNQYRNRYMRHKRLSFNSLGLTDRIACLAERIAQEKIDEGFGGLLSTLQDFQNDSEIKKLMENGYDRGLLRYIVKQSLIHPFRNEVRDAIVRVITPVLTAEIKKNSCCTLL
jgi:hypothetical protein